MTSRCLLLIGCRPGVERLGTGLVDQGVAYRSVGFNLAGGVSLDDDHALAAHLRELADALEAPSVLDVDLV